MGLSPTLSGYARCKSSVDLVLILIVAGVVLAGAFAIAAALAAGGDDRTRAGSTAERMAIWQAGYSPHELRLLAGLAALARTDLDAATVEVVLTRGDGAREGIVVTGSRLPPGRLGATVKFRDGIAGRGLAAGRTTLEDGGTGVAVPIQGPGGIVGVIAATAGVERRFDTLQVARLETLAAEHGSRLGIRAASLRDAG